MLFHADYSSHTTIDMDSGKNSNDATYQPLKPVICRFFKPKVKSKTLNGFNNVVKTNKPAYYIDLDSENRLNDISNENSIFFTYLDASNQCQKKTIGLENELYGSKQSIVNLSPQSIKLESSPYELETAVISVTRSLSSIESSSLSNFPQFSGPYSKSTQSLSDTELFDPSTSTPTPPPAPVVSDVYSLNKAYISPNGPPKQIHTMSTESLPSVADQFLVDLTDGEELRRITNIFQLVKQVVPGQPGQSTDQFDNHSINSGSLTEPMLDDRDDLEEICPVFQPLLQPSVVLEAIEFSHMKVQTNRGHQGQKRSAETAEKVPRRSYTAKPSKEVCGLIENTKEQTDIQSDCVILGEEKLPPSALRKHSHRSRRSETTEKVIKNKKRSHSVMNSDSSDKKYIYCFQCRKNYPTLCDKHPVTWILNDDIECAYTEYKTDGSYDKFFRDRRMPGEEKRHCQCKKNELEHIQMGMPREFSLRESKDSEIGVWTTTALNLGTFIGPYLGDIVENWTSLERTRSRRTPSYAQSKSELSCLQNAFKSNWLRYINFTNDSQKANLKITIYDEKTFYQTIKVVYPESELFVCKRLEFGVANNQNPRKLSSTTSKSLNERKGALVVSSAHDSVSQSTPLTESSFCSSVTRSSLPTTNSSSDQTPSSITIFDHDQLQYLGHLLLTTPSLGCSALNSLIRARFPDKPAVTDMHIDRVIRWHRLRPLCGLNSGLANRAQIEAIVELYREQPRLTLVDCEKILAKQFTNGPRLDLRSIDRIVELNRCRMEGPEHGPDYRVDKDVLFETRTLLGEQPTLKVSELLISLTNMFPDKRNMLTRPYVKFLIKKFHLRRADSVSMSKTGSVSESKAGTVPKVGSVSVSKARTVPNVTSKAYSLIMPKENPTNVHKTSSLIVCEGSTVTLPRASSVAIAQSSSNLVSKPDSVTLSRANSIFTPKTVTKYRSVCMDEQMRNLVRSICRQNPEMTAPRINARLRIEMPNKPEVSNRSVLNAIRKVRQALQNGKK